ncbi:MAG: hypothetical protein IJH12_05315 [Clostridia bacterium]|nr:hypothetical protein [Clostridia bacterium]
MSEKIERTTNFIVNYLKTHGGKLDQAFIQKYLGTGATIEVFIYRALQGKIYGNLFDKLYIGLSKKFSDLSKEKLEEKTEKIMKKKSEKVEAKIEKRIKKILGSETYDELQKKLNAYNIGIEGQDVSNCDFSDLSQEEFEMLRFDEDTNFEGATFPECVNPEEILNRRNTEIENQNNNEDMLHIAIIDTPMEYSGDVATLEVHNSGPQEDHHGRSVYSIFSSVNPNCVVHFYGVGPEDNDRAEAVQAIIDYNNGCTDESKKIRLVSCSHNLGENESQLIKDGGLNAISADNLHHGDFFEYFRFGSTDVVPELKPEEGDSIIGRYTNPAVAPIAGKYVNIFKSFGEAVLVNVNLAIDQPSSDKKRHECDLSVSWGVPVVAAYYAMALRANPDISYKVFHGICKKSLKEGTHILDEDSLIKILQNKELLQETIQAIEQEIEQEKTKYKLVKRGKSVTGRELGSQVVADIQDIEGTDKESAEIARQERATNKTEDKQNIGE